MAQSVVQSSFAAGELSQNLFARVDLDKYHTGAALLRNFFVDYRGGASTRPGTALVSRAKSRLVKSRLVPFIFSQTQSYVLELGDFYMRFYSNGGQLLNPSHGITAITRANPGVLTIPAHGFTTGTYVYVFGVNGMTQINGETYLAVVVDANHITLTTQDGVAVNTSLYSPYVSAGFISSVYEIATPWSYIDLPKLKFVQSADVMTFTHHLYPIQNLSRTGPNTFTLTPMTIGAALAAPVISAVTASVAGNLTYQYEVVAVTKDGERSLPSVLGGAASKALDPTAGVPVTIQITWGAVAGADHYDVFKNGPTPTVSTQPTYFGYIGTTDVTSFTDSNIAPDYSNGPPQFRNPFAGSNYPGCVSYFQQRRVFANLALSPEEMDFSKVGAYANFDTSYAVLDSDAIQIAIASRQVNEIVSMVPTASGLVVLTSGGAFLVSGGGPTQAITPSNIVALPQASSGANDLPPILVNYDILFVQNKGSIVRDLAYNFYVQTFYGFDRSALSNHLFFGHQLLEWAWAEEPFKIIWAVRDDGRMLSLTYVPEQEVYGWSQHDTQGIIESVCSVPEGDEDAVYLIVQRSFMGTQVRYVERMASRNFSRVEDCWFVDCGVATELTRPGYGFFVSANPTTAFLQADTGLPFDPSWVGQIIWLDVGGKMRVSTYSSGNQIVCDILEPLGNQLPGTDPAVYYQIQGNTWGYGPEVSTLTGLLHLQGQNVSVLADGESVGPRTVTAQGTITLPSPASKVVAGLSFQSQLQTLYLDVGDPTIQGRRKKISAMTVRLDKTRGLLYGQSFNDLYEFKSIPAPYSTPLPLFSGDERTIINGRWSEEGQVCCEQSYPLPATVLGIIPEVTLGDTQS